MSKGPAWPPAGPPSAPPVVGSVIPGTEESTFDILTTGGSAGVPEGSEGSALIIAVVVRTALEVPSSLCFFGFCCCVWPTDDDEADDDDEAAAADTATGVGGAAAFAAIEEDDDEAAEDTLFSRDLSMSISSALSRVASALLASF